MCAGKGEWVRGARDVRWALQRTRRPAGPARITAAASLPSAATDIYRLLSIKAISSGFFS